MLVVAVILVVVLNPREDRHRHEAVSNFPPFNFFWTEKHFKNPRALGVCSRVDSRYVFFIGSVSQKILQNFGMAENDSERLKETEVLKHHHDKATVDNTVSSTIEGA